MEILAKLGIDWKLFVAQIVNFVILLLVLRRFAYQPILNLLEERREKIEQGLKHSDEATEYLKSAREESSRMLAKAKQDAQRMIEEAQGMAEKTAKTIISESQEEANKIVEDARRKMQQEKVRIMDDVRADMVNLITLAMEKTIQKRFDSEDDQKFIDATLEKVA